MRDAASWCDQLIKPVLGSQAVTVQPWETDGGGGKSRGVDPKGHLLMPCALAQPIVLLFLGPGAWACLSRDGVKKCRSSPQLAPHQLTLQGR